MFVVLSAKVVRVLVMLRAVLRAADQDEHFDHPD